MKGLAEQLELVEQLGLAQEVTKSLLSSWGFRRGSWSLFKLRLAQEVKKSLLSRWGFRRGSWSLLSS